MHGGDAFVSIMWAVLMLQVQARVQSTQQAQD
jgi:hypothetical protein